MRCVTSFGENASRSICLVLGWRMDTYGFNFSTPVNARTGVVFSSPHSGRDYRADFLNSSILNSHDIRMSEDAFVDQLFDQVTEFGAPLLAARAPRAYVDLNRANAELDPALIEGVRKSGINPRVFSGLGVIPRVVGNGRPIYSGKLTMDEVEKRLSQAWRPYHTRLQHLLDQARMNFGQAILIDCHSMPHEAVNPRGRFTPRAPQIVLGDRFGAAADRAVVNQIEAAFVGAGFRVSRNAPFAGAYITQHYGRPSRQQHVVQIEIDRALYMDEATITPLPHFAMFKRRLRTVIAEIVKIGQPKRRLAAE